MHIAQPDISGQLTVEKNKYSLSGIYFYITDCCNLFCRHCWINPRLETNKNSSIGLDFELFKSIIEQAKPLGLTFVKLGGGEPLMHPKIKEFIRESNMRKLNLTIETNGLLCSQEIAQEIAQAKSSFVSVSLDSAEAKIHDWIRQVDGSFQGAINGIRNLVKAGIRPQIIMTLMRSNKEQVEPLLHLAEELGAGSVKFNFVLPIARGKQMHNDNQVLTVPELLDLERWVEDELSKTTSLKIFYSRPLAFRPLSKLSFFRDNKDFCGMCTILNILGVLADGSYALCGIGETTPQLVFGKAGRDSLADIWGNASVLRQLRAGLPEYLEGVCSRCVMRKLCQGCCIAQNYYTHNNLWAGFWFCEEAYKAGLFPRTRIDLKQSIAN